MKVPHPETWVADDGVVAEALDHLLDAGASGELAALLEEHGDALLSSGHSEIVLVAHDLLPPTALTPPLHRLLGDALKLRGDWDGALAAYAKAAGEEDAVDPALAWRIGSAHRLRGDASEALSVYGRARRDGSDPVGEALLAAWTATAHWGRGEVHAARDQAEAALAQATAAGALEALAGAHAVLAMVAAVEGDRSANEAHYARARSCAERTGDLFHFVHIRTNHGAHLCYEGRFDDALVELDGAVELSELAGSVSFRALAIYHRGYARFALGRLEEAVADFETSRSLYEAIGSSHVAYPLRGLGDVYRERGDRALARAAYEEAVSVSQRGEDEQVLVPALTGLARVLLPEEPEAAAAALELAVGCRPGVGHACALVVAGWAALAEGIAVERWGSPTRQPLWPGNAATARRLPNASNCRLRRRATWRGRGRCSRRPSRHGGRWAAPSRRPGRRWRSPGSAQPVRPAGRRRSADDCAPWAHEIWPASQPAWPTEVQPTATSPCRSSRSVGSAFSAGVVR